MVLLERQVDISGFEATVDDSEFLASLLLACSVPQARKRHI